MHLKNGDKPYQSALDALSKWPEVVTAIGVRVDERTRRFIQYDSKAEPTI
jgi:hypothetical protein